MKSSVRLRYLIAIPICLGLTFMVTTRLRWPGTAGDLPVAVTQQEAQWAAKGPSRYILTVTHTAAGKPTWFTLSQVTRGKLDNVICRRYEKNDSISECGVTDALFPITIDQVFEAVKSAYRSKLRGIDVQYDPRTGHPTGIHFDPVSEKTGDEWGYEIELSPAPPEG